MQQLVAGLPPRWPSCGVDIDAGAMWGDAPMLRVDGFYLYRLGSQISPITQFETGATGTAVYYPVILAQSTLDTFLRYAVFNVRTCVHPGEQFLQYLGYTRTLIEKMPNRDEQLDWLTIFTLKDRATTFQNVLQAELGTTDLYYVSKKGTHTTVDLITNGALAFPASLATKVPEAIFDAREACKCLAFEVPTACGFHLHRAVEAVLRKYWDALTNGKKQPGNRTISDYLRALGPLRKGSPKVKAALRDLNKLHRNPLIHPKTKSISIRRWP